MSQRLIDSLAADVMVARDTAAQLAERYESTNLGQQDEIIAGMILRSPELQQIRSTLLRMTTALMRNGQIMTRRSVLVNYGLPDHVIEWVLG